MNGDERQVKVAEVPDTFRPDRNDAGKPSQTNPVDATADSELIRISAWMYLRTIFLMAWSAFRHPFRTTYIDMASGEAVHLRPGEETWE